MQNHVYNQKSERTPLLSAMNSSTIVLRAALKDASHLAWPAAAVVPSLAIWGDRLVGGTLRKMNFRPPLA